MTEAQKKRALKKQAVIDYMKILPVNKYACANAGISDETLSNWLKDDKEFLDKFQEAKSKFFSSKASRAKPEFLLERLDRETFGQKEEGGNINIIQLILEKYNAVEGVINEVPRPEEIEGGVSKSSL